MTPQMVALDETLSFAHRDDEAVKVRLRMPGGSVPAGRATVGLSSGARRFKVAADVTADEHGATVDFTAPGPKLRQLVWSLDIQPSSGGPSVLVEARLMARRDQPVALLPGPVPTTRLPAPSPRTDPSLVVRAAHRLPTPVQQVLRRGRAVARRRRA
jgi:hypothetical protein